MKSITKTWSSALQEELSLLIKDWLKQQGRTQADLRRELKAESTRMQALLEVLKKEYSQGGIPKVAERLCQIEEIWSNDCHRPNNERNSDEPSSMDPFDQLDLILEEIREDIEN